MYLTIMRQDINYAVHKFIRFLSALRTTHLQAAMRILHYIKRSPRQGLFFYANSTLQLKVFADAD